ncbi:MAG: aminotransferase class I/II-fold pyridoxal phosphate-dependent enzyme [Actinomycetota bacterium]
MTTRPWMSESARNRESAIVETVADASTDDVRRSIDQLVADNREIHERRSLNLNPATNVMNPRAEAVLAAGLGSRPSLGHPGAKYEVGLEAIEELEVITAELAGRVFGSAFNEIRVFSGAMANLTTFMACAKPGDAIIVPPPSIGGHVTHNTAGAAGLYGLDIHEAPIDPDRYTLDVEGVAQLAERVRPKLITVGASLNLLPHPVAELRTIADQVGAHLLFDAAHACGMIAGGEWPNPLVEGAHVMTMSTYKSLGGPAGGLIVTDDVELGTKIDAIAYPGLTANFDAGRTTALAITLLDWIEHGAAYAAEMVASASALAAALERADVRVFRTTHGPTTSHQFAATPPVGSSADDAVARLAAANLLTCAIGTPAGDAVRIGTPEAVRWGMTSDDMDTLAGFIADGLGDVPGVGDAVTAWRAPFDRVHFCT